MKAKRFAMLAALSALTAMSAHAADKPKAKPADDNMIGLTTPNGKLVYDFINLWFNEHKGEEAFDKYVSRDNYMNHAVYNSSVNKKKTFEEEKAEESRMIPPGTIFDIKQIISQGSLVFAHILAKQNKDAVGDEMVMILRVRDGKITDHWDLHTELKPDSAVFTNLDR